MTANIYENPFGCKCQLSSIIQGTSRETESKESKTSRGRKS